MDLQHSRRRVASIALVAALAAGSGALSACSTPRAAAETPGSTAASAVMTQAQTTHQDAGVAKQIALTSTMHDLWAQHMEWTFATVDAFFHQPDSLQAKLQRILKNQKDIGAAVGVYYGTAAGTQLATLLTEHIEDAVPVLTAAKAGDATALQAALDTWYANAKQIADFLSAANPVNWPTSITEPMLKDHITTTTTYAVDLLKGDYTTAIGDYDKAEQHMLMFGDVLAQGIIAQFPGQFRSGQNPMSISR